MTSDVEPARGRIGARSFVIRSLLVLALPLSFRTFQFFPGMLYVQEGWFVLCCLFVIFVYPFWKLRNGLRVSRFELYLLLLITSSFSVAAWQAQGRPKKYLGNRWHMGFFLKGP
jgi:hypothetical protein